MLNEMETFAKRLRQARVKEKISMEALSRLLNGSVSKQAISKYEAAKMMPSSTILIALADALRVDLDYFFRSFAFDVQEMKVSFRKKASVGTKDIEALKVNIQDEIERYLEIEEILGDEGDSFEGIPCEQVLLSYNDMVKYAQVVRNKWQLGSDPIANVQDMLEANGVKFITTEGPDGFDGVSGMINGKFPVIVLNSKIGTAERKRFTALHELGHLLFNDKFSEKLSTREIENMCNAFANEMLLPTSVIAKTLEGKNKISLNELIFLQETYGISIDAIMYKLYQKGIVTEKRYKSFRIRKNVEKETFGKVVDKERFLELQSKKVSRFKAMVYSALAQQLITASKAASLLKCSVTTVRDTVNVI